MGKEIIILSGLMFTAKFGSYSASIESAVPWFRITFSSFFFLRFDWLLQSPGHCLGSQLIYELIVQFKN